MQVSSRGCVCENHAEGETLQEMDSAAAYDSRDRHKIIVGLVFTKILNLHCFFVVMEHQNEAEMPPWQLMYHCAAERRSDPYVHQKTADKSRETKIYCSN